MAIEYREADESVLAIVMEQLRLNHPELHETGAVIGVIMAYSTDDKPAVKHHGSPAFATIKVVSAKDRTKKKCDAEMLIDAREWEQFDDAQRPALADHELSHLVRVDYKPKQLAKLREDNPDHPAWKLDCHGRPRLKTIPADFTPGDAFSAVIKRHGKAATEFVGAKRFHQFAEAAMSEHQSAV